MPDIINLYLDDSGTRNPDRHIKQNINSGYDWFALGGVMIRESDEQQAREAHAAFCSEWDIKDPLHSSEIRMRTNNFSSIASWPKPKQNLFYEKLGEFLTNQPVIGIACVIDRPGYQDRYLEKYGRNRWALCKTAFSVVVERALKYAVSQKCKLRVLPERSSKKDDGLLRSYFDSLKKDGNPFSGDSTKYQPLDAAHYGEGLYDFKTKFKSSPITQIADLYLYPMCRGGYDEGYKPYLDLKNKNRLINCHLEIEHISSSGIKYSCFDFRVNSESEKTKGQQMLTS